MNGEVFWTNSRFSRREAQVLFRLRSQTLDVRKNFGNQFNDTLCRICNLFSETQSHLLQCPVIALKLKLLCLGPQIDEKHVFGSVDEQLKVAKIYCKILDLRKEILDERDWRKHSIWNLLFQIGLCMCALYTHVQQLQYCKL